LGAAGFVVEEAAGAPAGPAVATFWVGALGIAVVVLNDPRRRLARQRQTMEPLPASAVVMMRFEAVARAVYPSTAGLVVLVGISVGLGRGLLAALLCGFLAGLGVASLVSGIGFLLRERRSGCEYYAGHGGEIYVREHA